MVRKVLKKQSNVRLLKLGQRLGGVQESVLLESGRFLRDGATISREGRLKPTARQIKQIYESFKRLERQKTNLFSKIGALSYAVELDKAGRHWAAGRIRALAIRLQFSKTPKQKLYLHLDYL